MTLPRPQRPGSVYAMLSDAFGAAGRRAIEDELGHSQPRLSAWTNSDEIDGRAMPVAALDRIARLFPAAAAVMATHFATLAGGVYVPPRGANASLNAAIAQANAAATALSGGLCEALDPEGPGGAALTASELRALADRAAAAEHAARDAGERVRAAFAAAEGRS